MPAAYFDTFGPYPVAHGGDKNCPANQEDMWQTIADRYYDIRSGIGCYTFCLRSHGKLKPWYVGMTVARRGFEGECFQPHKLGIYNDLLSTVRGKPMMFLFPLINNRGHLSTAHKTAKPTIQWLERTLMGFAYARNPDIANVRDMNYLRNVQVNGLMGPNSVGRPYNEVAQAREAFGMKARARS